MGIELTENRNFQGFLSIHDRFNTLIRTDSITATYEIEPKPLARGRYGTVRRCQHKTTNVDYAAKFIRKRQRAIDIRHEIIHEIAVFYISRDCKQIVHLHEVFETKNEFVLVLEFAPGGDLHDLIDNANLQESDVIRLMRQILDALIFLHDEQIAHLDIKPQNVLLTSFPYGDVKLCDFGLSRFLQDGEEIREIKGTADYVAPEVLSYDPISLATDMWSVGVLAYVLLTGHSPFADDGKQKTFYNISRVSFHFPEDLFAGVSSAALDFIRKLLIKKPCLRMTARECLDHAWLAKKIPTHRRWFTEIKKLFFQEWCLQ